MSMLESGDQALFGPPATGESQPIHEFALTMLRYLPFILVLSGLAGAGMYVLTEPEEPTPLASAQLGLTQEVVWPFFDAARQRVATDIEQPDFAEELATRLDDAPTSIEVTIPEDQASLIVEVTTRTPSGAAAAANEAVALAVERDIERTTAVATAELGRAEDTLDASLTRSASMERRLDQLVPIEAAARAAVSDDPTDLERREEALRAELERTNLAQAFNEEVRRQVDLRIQVDGARAAIGASTAEVQVVRLADSPDAAAERSLLPVIAAALGAGVLGLGAAILWDRARGAVSSQWHAEQVAGVPVLADLGPQRSRDRAAGLFLTTLMDEVDTHGNIVAITALPGVDIEEWLGLLVHQFEFIGVDVVALSEPSHGPVRHGIGQILSWEEVERASDRSSVLQGASTIMLPESLTILDAAFMRSMVIDIAEAKQVVLVGGGTVGDRECDQALALADAAVLLTRKRGHRVDQLRRAARVIRSRRKAFLGTVLIGRSLPVPTLPTGIAQPPKRTFDPTTTQQLV